MEKVAPHFGRPSKYDPAYCQQIIDFMSNGYSMTAFAGHIKVSRTTITTWMAEHPDFLAAVNVGKAARALMFEGRLLNDDLAGPQITATIFGLKNIAPEEWSDRRDVNIGGQQENPLRVSLDMAADDFDNAIARKLAAARTAGALDSTDED